MNTDIRIAIDFWQHPKTKKLIRRVGIEGIRSLQILWTWAANNKPDGNLAGMDEEDIELAADWQGDIGAFFKALVETRWIDETDSGYALHEWLEHNPWVADDENRSNKARLSKLQQVNAAAYNKCVEEGKTGLTKTEYESLKGYSANAEEKDGDRKHEEKQDNSGDFATAERPQSERRGNAEGNASETLAPKPSPIPTVLNTPLSPKGDIPPRGEQPAKKRRKEEPPRQAYGQFQQVLLTEDEHSKLEAEFGIKGAQDMIDRLDGYIASKGVKYKNHYATIMNWHRKDVKEEQQQQAQVPALPQGVPRFSNYGQQVKWDQQQQARALLAVGDKYKDNPEDIPPEWR